MYTSFQNTEKTFMHIYSPNSSTISFSGMRLQQIIFLWSFKLNSILLHNFLLVSIIFSTCLKLYSPGKANFPRLHIHIPVWREMFLDQIKFSFFSDYLLLLPKLNCADVLVLVISFQLLCILLNSKVGAHLVFNFGHAQLALVKVYSNIKQVTLN